MPSSDLILLAIDNDQILQLLERALIAASYRVAIAPDRISLDKKLQDITPALVIISEQFANNSGLDTCGVLLERFPTLPLILFTSTGSADLLKKAILLGISDCILPPLKQADISQAVEASIKKAQRIGDWTRREVKRSTASLETRVSELLKMELILNNIEDGVIILDQSENLLLVNPAARRIFDIQQENLIEKNINEVISNQDLLGIISLGVSTPSKYNEIKFDDKRVYSVQYSEIPSIGKALTLQNISYLKQIEQMKNEFISTVSHDLRSPLTSILGYIELLDRVGPINEQQADFILRVQSSIQNITSLINDLLELGRIEAGISGTADMVPLGKALNYGLENLNLQITNKKINLHTNFPIKIPFVYGNPVQIRQLLDNLLGNAVKYTPEGGDIAITVKVDGGQLILQISDTGVGIPLSDQPHIFEKFYRASNVPSRVSGSGLGLAIVKSIVDAHDGRIWVDSIVGKGTTFTVVLPLIKTGQLSTIN